MSKEGNSEIFWEVTGTFAQLLQGLDFERNGAGTFCAQEPLAEVGSARRLDSAAGVNVVQEPHDQVHHCVHADALHWHVCAARASVAVGLQAAESTCCIRSLKNGA